MRQANVAVTGLATLTGQPGGSVGSKCSTDDDLAPCYVLDQDRETERQRDRLLPGPAHTRPLHLPEPSLRSDLGKGLFWSRGQRICPITSHGGKPRSPGSRSHSAKLSGTGNQCELSGEAAPSLSTPRPGPKPAWLLSGDRFLEMPCAGTSRSISGAMLAGRPDRPSLRPELEMPYALLLSAAPTLASGFLGFIRVQEAAAWLEGCMTQS